MFNQFCYSTGTTKFPEFKLHVFNILTTKIENYSQVQLLCLYQ